MCEFTTKTNFTLELTKKDTMAFKLLTAERGLTPEKLLESFVRDIVSSFFSDEITEEQKTLSDWFDKSWFSQDNDGYFSFLQYAVINNQYENIICLLNKQEILDLFNKYCSENPAHKSFDEEVKAIWEFSDYIKNN